MLLGCEVASLRRNGEGGGATVAWRQNGTVREAAFDRVLCTLPPPLLAELDTDFSPARRAGLRALAVHPAGKLAFHAARRFWEEDAAIYGGISWTTRDATQIWYPSHGFGRADGRHPGRKLCLGRGAGAPLRRPHAGRARRRRRRGWRSPARRLCARGLAPRLRVLAAHAPRPRRLDGVDGRAAPRPLRVLLRAPEGPYHFAGEHLSFLPGWQEGAVLSAWAAVEGMAV